VRYEITIERVDYGAQWGVGMRVERGGKIHRHTIWIEDGTMTEGEAAQAAVPQLFKWALDQSIQAEMAA